MAIDSAAKRRNVSGIAAIPLGPGVTPNASPGVAWRQQVGWGYAGIAPAVADPLVITSIIVPVRYGGHEMVLTPLAPSTRAYDGQLRSATTTTRPKLRTWRFQTGYIAWSDGLTLEAALRAAGRVTTNGYLVGGSEIECYVQNIRREPQITITHMALSFELHEAGD